MALVYLSLGSNLGDREKFLSEARESIQKDFPSARFSRVYETEPVEYTNQPWFLNQVAEFNADRTAESLLLWAQSLEQAAGRKREVPKGPRTLDADILLYGGEIRKDARLSLPHPGLALRRHVLVPLSELSPGLLLPGLGLTAAEALEKVKDSTQVKLYAHT